MKKRPCWKAGSAAGLPVPDSSRQPGTQGCAAAAMPAAESSFCSASAVVLRGLTCTVRGATWLSRPQKASASCRPKRPRRRLTSQRGWEYVMERTFTASSPMRHRKISLIGGCLAQHGVDQARSRRPAGLPGQIHRLVDSGAVGNSIQKYDLVNPQTQNVQQRILQVVRLLGAVCPIQKSSSSRFCKHAVDQVRVASAASVPESSAASSWPSARHPTTRPAVAHGDQHLQRGLPGAGGAVHRPPPRRPPPSREKDQTGSAAAAAATSAAPPHRSWQRPAARAGRPDLILVQQLLSLESSQGPGGRR
jgi:hypothetical protein